MHSYVIYRIALSLHLEILFGLWIATLDRTLNLQLTVFIAIFADLATLAIAYDNAPYSTTPVKKDYVEYGVCLLCLASFWQLEQALRYRQLFTVRTVKA